jgi:hypothetical protein
MTWIAAGFIVIAMLFIVVIAALIARLNPL